MSVKIAPSPRQQFVDANGVPYSGAKLFTYAAGSTTKQATYTDSTGSTPNSNPIILDSAGRTPYGRWYTAGVLYKEVLAPSTDTDPPTSPIFTEDNISGINDTSVSTSEWVASGVTPTYIAASQFSVPGDQTTEFHVNRRVKLTVSAGTVYGTITVSAYTTLTTVTVSIDSGTLDNGLSSVELSILGATHNSLPKGIFAELAGADFTGPVSFAGAVTFGLGSGIQGAKNRIINGRCQIDQEHNGAAQTITAGAALAYTIDRFYAYCTGADVTGQQITADGRSTYRFTGAASNTGVGWGQRIAADNSYDLAGGTASFQIALASSSLTSITWTAYYANSKDAFGTLASPTKTQIATGTLTINGTEAVYKVEGISIPAAASTGIEFVFTGGALLETQTLTYGDFQVESGSVCHDLEAPDITQTLVRCLPYLEKIYALSDSDDSLATGQALSVDTGYFTVPFMSTKRGIPTISIPVVTGFSVSNAAGTRSNSIGASVITDGMNSFILRLDTSGGYSSAGDSSIAWIRTGTILIRSEIA